MSPAPRSGCIANLLKWIFGGFVFLVFLAMISPSDPHRFPQHQATQQPQPAPQPPAKPKPLRQPESPPTSVAKPTQEARRNDKVAFDNFNERLKEIDPSGLLFKSTKLEPQIAQVTVAVFDAWHVLPYQQRLQAAQRLWKFWAVDQGTLQARIKITDLEGNEVGGSRLLSPDAIWVSEKQ